MDYKDCYGYLAALTFVVSLCSGAPLTDNDPVAEQISDLCKEKFYVETLIQNLKQRVQSTADSIKDMEKLKATWEKAAAATSDAAKKCLFSALEHKADAELLRELPKIEEATEAVTTAQIALSEHVGMLGATITLAKTKLDSGSSNHGNADTGSIRIALSRTTATTDLCNEPATISDIKPGVSEIQPGKLFKLKLTKPTDLHKHMFVDWLTIGGLKSCTAHTSYDQNFDGALSGCQYSASGTAVATQASTKPPYATAAVTLFKNNDPEQQCEVTDLPAGGAADKHKKLQHSLCRALQLGNVKGHSLRQLDGAALQSDHVVANTIRNCDPVFQKLTTATDGEGTTELKKYIKEAYGSSASEFAEKFITNAEKLQMTLRLNDKIETKDLSAVSPGEQTAAALSHIQGLHNKRELEAGKKSTSAAAVDPQKSEDCKGEKDETKCNKKDGCEFKDGECLAKVTTAAGTDGKTNTTGSNSFVIHKTPLLLAVLLLA
uniref:Variant surface glycoprotein Kinu 1 n=1 Tax=Trypanosoma brucei brucei TaxID=5702 RepID=Q571X3_TRYBB|nr:variant surface glycoprotein Kinu 1 [Trypanosoma brucei brucei]